MTMRHDPLPAPPPRPPESTTIIRALLDRQTPDPALLGSYTSPEATAARTTREAADRAQDWPALARYRAANAAVTSPDLVMIGDSLTEIWGLADPDLFGQNVINRGIAGQTSPQILLRFTPDVIDLKPRRVHILCGTNDIAGNTGPCVPEDFQRNIRAMVDLAQANDIAVLLASIPPAATIFWQPAARPQDFIPELNAWLRDFATTRGAQFIDYHSALTDKNGALQPRYSADGVHVTRAAYRMMRTILETF